MREGELPAAAAEAFLGQAIDKGLRKADVFASRGLGSLAERPGMRRLDERMRALLAK